MKKENLNQNKIKNKQQIRKELEDLIYIIIDMKRITKKTKKTLNKDIKIEKYYPINFKWLLKYIEYYKLNNLYLDQCINKTLENTIINAPDNLSNEEILEKAKLLKEFINILYNYSNKISESNFSTDIPKNPTKININSFFYYNNFILVSEDTIKLIFNEDISKQIYFYCYFGDNKIFITNNAPKLFLIEVYYLDNDNLYPEIFFKYNGKNELSNSLNFILEKGFFIYCKYYLLFNDDKNNIDYVSPIFDKDNKEIGYAFKYHHDLKDYSPYIINSEYKTLIKLYFNYMKFHSKSNRYKSGKYFRLINTELLKKYKEHYDYFMLEKHLSKNNIVQNISNNINLEDEYNSLSINSKSS